MYLITSDPSALRLEGAEPPVYSGLIATDQLGIHPALLSLSISAIGGSTFHNISKVILPVGRLLHGKPKILLHRIVENYLRICC